MNLMAKAIEDYDDYLDMCKELSIAPLGIHDDYQSEKEKILEEHKCCNVYQFFTKMKENATS